jgi:predicted anti-sigma-YlaC factor YlaD
MMTAYESTTTRMAHESPNICSLVEDLLPLYIEGEVSQASRDLLVEHLAQCSHCAGFLAGAQSMRTQLRRDQAARQAVVQLDRPAQQTLTNARRWLMLIIELGVATLTTVLAIALWVSLESEVQFLATLLAFGIFGAAVVFAHSNLVLSAPRVVKLGVLSFAGGIGAASLIPGVSNAPAFVIALLVFGSAAGIRYLLTRETAVRTPELPAAHVSRTPR